MVRSEICKLWAYLALLALAIAHFQAQLLDTMPPIPPRTSSIAQDETLNISQSIDQSTVDLILSLQRLQNDISTFQIPRLHEVVSDNAGSLLYWISAAAGAQAQMSAASDKLMRSATTVGRLHRLQLRVEAACGEATGEGAGAAGR